MLRLSELLERIRPAGSPGAAAEGDEQHRREILDDEIGDIARLLGEFEQEADQIVDEADREVVRIRQEGERKAHEIRARRADRVAVAEADAATARQDEGANDCDEILAASRERIAGMEGRAAGRMAEMVDAVIETIWTVDR